MTSDKQIQANRKNALKSTGPRTELGKSFSSKNATTHGLRSRQVVIEGESRAEYNDFRQMYIEHYAPANPIEAALVDRIVVCLWRLRRTETIEAQTFDNLREDLVAAGEENKQASLLITLPADPVAAGQESRDIQIGFLIIKVLKDCYKFRPDPQIASNISRMKVAIEYMRENPNTYYVPGLRRYHQSVRDQFAGTEYLSDEDAARMDEFIEYLRDLERQVEEDNTPNFGHAVAADITSNNVLTKLTSYESRIQSSLYKAMDKLEKLQKNRKGIQVPPQQPIDVEITK